MFLDLQNVPPEGQVVDRVIAATRLPFSAEDFTLADDVALVGRIEPVEPPKDGSFRMHGLLRTRVSVECVRCLLPASCSVEEPLDLVYVPSSENVARGSEEEQALDDQELSVSYYSDERIDLVQLIREQITLALPMKPLCRNDCRGLCPECGADWNTIECSCEQETIDPRMAKLKALLES